MKFLFQIFYFLLIANCVPKTSNRTSSALNATGIADTQKAYTDSKMLSGVKSTDGKTTDYKIEKSGYYLIPAESSVTTLAANGDQNTKSSGLLISAGKAGTISVEYQGDSVTFKGLQSLDVANNYAIVMNPGVANGVSFDLPLTLVDAAGKENVVTFKGSSSTSLALDGYPVQPCPNGRCPIQVYYPSQPNSQCASGKCGIISGTYVPPSNVTPPASVTVGGNTSSGTTTQFACKQTASGWQLTPPNDDGARYCAATCVNGYTGHSNLTCSYYTAPVAASAAPSVVPSKAPSITPSITPSIAPSTPASDSCDLPVGSVKDDSGECVCPEGQVNAGSRCLKQDEVPSPSPVGLPQNAKDDCEKQPGRKWIQVEPKDQNIWMCVDNTKIQGCTAEGGVLQAHGTTQSICKVPSSTAN